MTARVPVDFERVLAAGIKTILTNQKFRVADFSLSFLIKDEPFRTILTKNFTQSPGAEILLFAPDLFVIRPGIDPKKGVFFVKCFQTENSTTPRIRFTFEELQVYREFYPIDRVLAIVAV